MKSSFYMGICKFELNDKVKFIRSDENIKSDYFKVVDILSIYSLLQDVNKFDIILFGNVDGENYVTAMENLELIKE